MKYDIKPKEGHGLLRINAQSEKEQRYLATIFTHHRIDHTRDGTRDLFCLFPLSDERERVRKELSAILSPQLLFKMLTYNTSGNCKRGSPPDRVLYLEYGFSRA